MPLELCPALRRSVLFLLQLIVRSIWSIWCMFLHHESQLVVFESYYFLPRRKGGYLLCWWKSCTGSVERTSTWGDMSYVCISALTLELLNFLKKIKNSNNNNKRKQARYVVRKYCEGFGHYWSLRDMLIYHRSGNTALKYFVRAWAWVIWRNLSWLCIQNRITVLNVSTS